MYCKTGLLVLLFFMSVFSLAREKAEASPYPEFYNLKIEKARVYFNDLSTKQKFRLYLWDLENWSPHNMYLGNMLAKSGREVTILIESELVKLKDYNTFKVWRLLDVLTAVNELTPIICNDPVIITAQKLVDSLKKGPYEEEIAVRIKNLVEECN